MTTRKTDKKVSLPLAVTPGGFHKLTEKVFSMNVFSSYYNISCFGIMNIAKFCRQVKLNPADVNRAMAKARNNNETICTVKHWTFEFYSTDQVRDRLKAAKVPLSKPMNDYRGSLPRDIKDFAAQDRDFATLFHAFMER